LVLTETTIGDLTRFPHSVLATLWQQHRMSHNHKGPVRVNGDPSLFHLILNYLRRGKLPIVTDVLQLQWLEAEAEEYKLNGEGELADLCRDAYKRLDTAKIMQLLNGQRNLSAMDMRRLDLSDIDFRGASMYRQAKLGGAKLMEASFVQAVALNADFGNAELGGAKLGGAKLGGASFVEAVAPKADFSKTEMPWAKLGGAKLTEASFVQARLFLRWLAATLELKSEKTNAHSEEVTLVAFSPDGKTIVSGSVDKTIKVMGCRWFFLSLISARHTDLCVAQIVV
ncbi:MAG: hypothetical protein SGPRY_012268, partial [Prymnesium sp.]